MVSRDKIVFVFIDGYGSGFQGNKLLHSVTKKPGQLEMKQIETVLEWVKTRNLQLIVKQLSHFGEFDGDSIATPLRITYFSFTRVSLHSHWSRPAFALDSLCIRDEFTKLCDSIANDGEPVATPLRIHCELICNGVAIKFGKVWELL